MPSQNTFRATAFVDRRSDQHNGLNRALIGAGQGHQGSCQFRDIVLLEIDSSVVESFNGTVGNLHRPGNDEFSGVDASLGLLYLKQARRNLCVVRDFDEVHFQDPDAGNFASLLHQSFHVVADVVAVTEK